MFILRAASNSEHTTEHRSNDIEQPNHRFNESKMFNYDIDKSKRLQSLLQHDGRKQENKAIHSQRLAA